MESKLFNGRNTRMSSYTADYNEREIFLEFSLYS